MIHARLVERGIFRKPLAVPQSYDDWFEEREILQNDQEFEAIRDIALSCPKIGPHAWRDFLAEYNLRERHVAF